MAANQVRVLHVISSIDPRGGGPVVAIDGMVRALASAGAFAGLVATWKQSDDVSAAKGLREHGVEVTLAGPASGKLQRVANLATIVDSALASADVVHIHGLWEEIQHLAARSCQRRNIPYVITPHGMLTDWSMRQSRIKKWIYRTWRLTRNLNRAAGIHYITKNEQRLSDCMGLRVPAIVEPIGLDLTEFAELPEKDSFRSRHPSLIGRPVVTFLGRIHPGKGLEYLVPAIARTASDVMLVIVGPDSEGYRAKIEAEVKRLGISDRVIFAGMLKGPDRIAALVDADIFCLPSDHENFGLAVIESLAAGTPVLISGEVSVADEIVSGGVGAIVPRESERIAAELTRWLSDSPRRANAAQKCRAFVAGMFDWNHIARHWMERYEQMKHPHAISGNPGRITSTPGAKSTETNDTTKSVVRG